MSGVQVVLLLAAAALVVGIGVAAFLHRVFGWRRDRRPGYITDTTRSHR